MLTSQKIAIAAHLHVLLRRKTGRVTDTEWMATNLAYAQEIIQFARARAAQDGHPDLGEWADKLEQSLLQAKPAERQPLMQGTLQALRDRQGAPSAGSAASTGPAPGTPTESVSSSFGRSTHGDSSFQESTQEPGAPPKVRDPSAPRYVGGIR